MGNILQSFRRNTDGSWTCIAPVTLEGPQGRIQVVEGASFRRGSSFMGVDIARFLDAAGNLRLE